VPLQQEGRRTHGAQSRPHRPDDDRSRISPSHDRVNVVDLVAERRRRLARDLGLAPTVPVPCGPGPCRCYGGVLGGSA
jgi:hypothetical protein